MFAVIFTWDLLQQVILHASEKVKMNSILKSVRIVFAVTLSSLVFVACEEGGNSQVDEESALFVRPSSTSSTSTSSAPSSTAFSAASVLPGTWKLVASDGSFWYIHFAADGTWKITDDAAGEKRRVYGSYKTEGQNYSGDMKNPGVGDGTISGKVLSKTSLDLDFCEHWHTPYKHVAYTGTKL